MYLHIYSQNSNNLTVLLFPPQIWMIINNISSDKFSDDQILLVNGKYVQCFPGPK